MMFDRIMEPEQVADVSQWIEHVPAVHDNRRINLKPKASDPRVRSQYSQLVVRCLQRNLCCYKLLPSTD
jgi:hypothetical protein